MGCISFIVYLLNTSVRFILVLIRSFIIKPLQFMICQSSFRNYTISFSCSGLSQASTFFLAGSFTTEAAPTIWDALPVFSAASLTTGFAPWVTVMLAVLTIWAVTGAVSRVFAMLAVLIIWDAPRAVPRVLALWKA